MKKTKNLLYGKLLSGFPGLMAVLLLSFSLILACDDGSGNTTPNTNRITTVTITGTAKVGQVLTAMAKDESGSAVTDATFRWKSSGSENDEYADISNATASAYTPAEADEGKYIKVEAKNNATTTAVLSAEAKGPVTAADDGNNKPLTGTVSITGKAEVYRTLTVDLSGLSKPAASYQWEWQIADTSDGSYSDIPNAIEETYTLTSEDKGKYIKVTVTHIDYYTGNGTRFTSEATGPVASFTINLSGLDGIYEKIYEEFATLPENTPETPNTVAFNLNNSNLNPLFVHIDWAVKSEDAGGKYVILDFSGCTVLDDEIPKSGSDPIFGEYDSSNSKDNIYIKGYILPATLTKIGDKAFYGYEHLASVIIPASVNSIGGEAFAGCNGLTSVTIGNGVISIGYRTFYDCSSLTGIIIPDSVTDIGDEAFYGYTSLTSVAIPAGVTSIGSGAFSGCTSLTGITVAAGNANYASEDGVLFNHAKTTLICYPTSKTGDMYTIPSGVTSIGSGAFNGCAGLTGIIIPDSVTDIGREAFYGCTGLTSVTSGNGLISIGNCVTSIGIGAFYGCAGLTSVIIPASVTSIGGGAFAGCTSLTSVTFAGSNTVITEGSTATFPGGDSLLTAGGASESPYKMTEGTYTRETNGSTWTKTT